MKRSLLFLFSFFLTVESQAQVLVTTFENSDSIWIDDAVYMDSYGNVYGSHFEGSEVYKIAPDGTSEKIIDGLYNPNGLEMDTQQNLYVVDHGGNKVYKVAPDGTSTEFVNYVHRPSGIVKYPHSDTMLVTRYYGDMILRVAPDGVMDTLYADGLLNGPVGFAFDENDELYIGNFDDRKIIHIHQDGSMHEFAQIPGGNNLGFIAYDAGYFYGTSFQLSHIYQVRKSDTLISKLAGLTVGELDGDTSIALFNRPNGIAFSRGKDSLLISDYATGNVRVITQFKVPNTTHTLLQSIDELSASPNPFEHALQVSVQLSRSMEGKVSLITLEGMEVFTREVMWSKGRHELNISTADLPSGMYFIAISTENQIVYKSIVRQ